ncbi:PREDICTED: uncharacterized protein LOC104813420 [Tarenaya hassleriana]|uniref:uncharacterized protein LOC104813420 n=1 Tax=Tarenaya hassleriana TaxID=28532 RepID=UPI00053C15DF|nr:PREDICTED: uncharacterized protein LOC104813420 [Tarenaya hassleriana]
MVQKLELIKGGGGSIKIGTTGTVAALMTRELDAMERTPPQTAPTSRSNRTIPVSVDCVPSSSTPRRAQARKPSDEASSSVNPVRTPKGYHPKSTHSFPMLGSDNVSLHGTPRREKRTNIVEIVDVKCGNPDRAWANPITSKLKKLGFSKLSENSA